jgi:uncharacterized protein
MKWTPGDRGSIEDERGRSGLRMGAPLGIGGILVVLLLSWATGIDFTSLLDTTGGGAVPPSASVGTGAPVSSPAEEHQVDLVGAVLDDAQKTWREKLGGRYQDTKAVLFRDSVQSACGSAQSATGPFYCPADRKIYLDLSFFDELRQRFRAPGEFAEAYVLAHELGHHIQTLLGTEAQVRARLGSDPSQKNALSVRVELQADCYAGIWGHHAAAAGPTSSGGVQLEDGDIEDALKAASAIGDDRIQRRSSGRVSPETFTHGSSEQRVSWFRRGFQSGDPQVCDTFRQGTN